MDDALKQVEKVILAAAPAYEMYFLQTMGKPYRLKMPLLHVNREKVKVTYDSVEHSNGANKTPDRLVMYVEFNRAMGSSTITTEYWNNAASGTEPQARGEAKVDATSENLMAPAFAFGWLNALVGAVEGVDAVDAQMERAEQLILKADAVLEELGYVIETDSYVSYADTLDRFLLTAGLNEQTEGVLSKVGGIVRGAAKAFGAARGGYRGLKKRWSDFKSSVKGAYDDAHKKAFDKFSGGKEAPASKPGDKSSAPKKGKLKLVKGGKSGKKMSDKEYRSRYGKSRPIAASAEEPDLNSLVDDLRDDYFEQEFLGLKLDDLLVLEELALLMRDSDAEQLDEAGGRFQKLVGKLQGKAKNPAALAAWIGRKKYGKEKFQKMAAEGRSKRKLETAQPVSGAISSYQKLSGLVLPMQGWSLYKGK